jgi:hypothetical protein
MNSKKTRILLLVSGCVFALLLIGGISIIFYKLNTPPDGNRPDDLDRNNNKGNDIPQNGDQPNDLNKSGNTGNDFSQKWK